MITSLQNNQVKNIIKLNQKAKARREQGLFIAEGRKMFLEAPLHWIEKVYVSETVEKQDTEVMEKASQCQWLMDYFKERGIEASIDRFCFQTDE